MSKYSRAIKISVKSLRSNKISPAGMIDLHSFGLSIPRIQAHRTTNSRIHLDIYIHIDIFANAML